MEKLIAGVIATSLYLLLLVFAITAGSLFGALTGILTGVLFGDTITNLFGQLGIHAKMWEIGSTLGFVSAFFRTSIKSK